MTAVTFWVLLAFLPATHDRPPVMVIERFATPTECLDVLAVFPFGTRIDFTCMPSRQIRAGATPTLENHLP